MSLDTAFFISERDPPFEILSQSPSPSIDRIIIRGAPIREIHQPFFIWPSVASYLVVRAIDRPRVGCVAIQPPVPLILGRENSRGHFQMNHRPRQNGRVDVRRLYLRYGIRCARPTMIAPCPNSHATIRDADEDPRSELSPSECESSPSGDPLPLESKSSSPPDTTESTLSASPINTDRHSALASSLKSPSFLPSFLAGAPSGPFQDSVSESVLDPYRLNCPA